MSNSQPTHATSWVLLVEVNEQETLAEARPACEPRKGAGGPVVRAAVLALIVELMLLHSQFTYSSKLVVYHSRLSEQLVGHCQRLCDDVSCGAEEIRH